MDGSKRPRLPSDEFVSSTTWPRFGRKSKLVAGPPVACVEGVPASMLVAESGVGGNDRGAALAFGVNLIDG